MATLRQTYVKVYACPSDPNPFTPFNPDSGPGGDGEAGMPSQPGGSGGFAAPKYMPGNYRCVAGADYGGQNNSQNGSNENWDDATQVAWLLTWAAGDRGVMHAVDLPAGTRPVRIPEITDGTSNTLMIGEYATMTEPGRRTYWAYAYTSYNESVVTIGQSRTLIADWNTCNNLPPGGSNQCKRAWGSFHTQGNLNFALCDGSVRSFSTTVDMNFLMPALATIAGGEVVGNY
jgi:hypothetical protein